MLLTMLNFSDPNSVHREDWDRGMKHLFCPNLSNDISWKVLLQHFDRLGTGSVNFGDMFGLAPLDPRLSTLLRIVVQTLVRLSERSWQMQTVIEKTKQRGIKATINAWRGRIQERVFLA